MYTFTLRAPFIHSTCINIVCMLNYINVLCIMLVIFVSFSHSLESVPRFYNVRPNSLPSEEEEGGEDLVDSGIDGEVRFTGHVKIRTLIKRRFSGHTSSQDTLSSPKLSI